MKSGLNWKVNNDNRQNKLNKIVEFKSAIRESVEMKIITSKVADKSITCHIKSINKLRNRLHYWYLNRWVKFHTILMINYPQ